LFVISGRRVLKEISNLMVRRRFFPARAQTEISSKNIFAYFAKSPALAALAAFILAHNGTIAWAAETLRLGFSGATATQLAGSLAVEQKWFDLYGVEHGRSHIIDLRRGSESVSL
jgi:hypothetical protein